MYLLEFKDFGFRSDSCLGQGTMGFQQKRGARKYKQYSQAPLPSRRSLYVNSGKTFTSFFISDWHRGHLGTSSKVNVSLIQPEQSSLVQDHILVSTSGIGSFLPLK